MTGKDIRETQCRGNRRKLRRGPTSYRMHDSELVFERLALQEGAVFLDMGCGPGDYSTHAAKVIGTTGTVYAMDYNAGMLEIVKSQAYFDGIPNIKTVNADITGKLPFEAQSVDHCFMSTSLHCINLATHGSTIFNEISRVLKPSGRLAVIECKKEDVNWGPPLSMRISPEEIKAVAEPLSFVATGYLDLGINYLIQFIKHD